ncbi:hypothetical protein J7643_12520 [bacterium]|nr:hypothetical protein [bacterium]
MIRAPRLALSLLTLLALTACRHLPITPHASRPLAPEGPPGQLLVTIRWPQASAYSAQAIPEAGTRAELSVTREGERPVATATLSRGEDGAIASASLALPPGEGYMLSAVLVNQQAQTVALGKSAPFAILRNRSAAVSLQLAPVIGTIAGTGTILYDATASTAFETALYVPSGMGLDAEGNLYVAVMSHHAIRKITPDGRIATVAGTGTATGAGTGPVDGLPARETTLHTPQGVTVSPGGDLVIADSGNKRLRFVPASDGRRFGKDVTAGNLYTLATTSFTPIAVTMGPDGSVYYSEGSSPNHPPRVGRLDGEGRFSVVAGSESGLINGDVLSDTSTALKLPDGLVVDARGNLMISDRNDHRIRMVCREPGTYFGIPMQAERIYTIAGTGKPTADNVSPLGDGGQGLAASFKSPRGLSLDARGNLYITDSSNCRIRRLSPNGIISTVAGNALPDAKQKPATWPNAKLGDGGSALEALLNFPAATLVGPGGSLYIADTLNYRIRRLWL